ncbi:MAG: LCP family protein [Pseudonocardiales bacterium]|nr:LCP family protein [Pseudonocardiales bacterium]
MTQVAPESARRGRSDVPHDGYTEYGRSRAQRGSAPEPSFGRHRGRHATGYDQGFSGVVGWTIIGSLLPGAGLIAAGRRTAGRLLLGVTLLTVAGLVGFALFGDTTAFALRFATNTNDLLLLAGGAVALSVLWAFVVLGTHVSLRRFATLTTAQRALSSLLVTSIIAAGGMVAAQTANYSLIGRTTLKAITDNGVSIQHQSRPKADAVDPWAGTPRVNVLLIGSDAGPDRKGIRTDSTILASIDTRTGDTLLIGIPRNLENVPFPPGTPMAEQYPNGYTCDRPTDPCLFNALWQFGALNAKDSAFSSYYGKFKNPGLQATIDGVEQTTKLPVNQYLILDLDSFKAFVNAMGGIDVNVQRRIPVAGHEDASGRQVGVKSYIEPGRKHLNGYYALWYARSRSDSSDFDRMARQRCVIGAITQQANPVTLARSFPELAAALQNDISTNIKLDDLSAWVTLLLRVKSAHVRSLPFTDANINPGHPDYDYIQKKIAKALVPPAPKPAAAGSSGSKSGTKSGSKATPTPTTPSDPGAAIDVKEAC